ncbi:unnamed protein product [Discula destructiva]
MEPNPFGDPPLDVQLRVCSEAAETFVTQFYRDVNGGNPLSAYYIDASTLYAAANESADIVINGAKLNSSAEFESLLEAQRGGPVPDTAATTTNGRRGASNNNNNNNNNNKNNKQPSRVRYEVDSLDTQPVNYDFQIALPSVLPKNETAYGGGCISMLVSVMGTLYLDINNDDDDDDGEPTRKTFTEAFVLWPNWAARGRGVQPRREKSKFLIASQNYRTL